MGLQISCAQNKLATGDIFSQTENLYVAASRTVIYNGEICLASSVLSGPLITDNQDVGCMATGCTGLHCDRRTGLRRLHSSILLHEPLTYWCEFFVHIPFVCHSLSTFRMFVIHRGTSGEIGRLLSLPTSHHGVPGCDYCYRLHCDRHWLDYQLYYELR